MKTNQKLKGEALITGKNQMEIKLLHGSPDDVIVGFKNHNNTASCNPHHDKLSWATEDFQGGFILTIKWHVQDAKEIIWEVSF